MAFGNILADILASMPALLGWFGVPSKAGAQLMPWEDAAYEANII